MRQKNLLAFNAVTIPTRKKTIISLLSFITNIIFHNIHEKVLIII